MLNLVAYIDLMRAAIRSDLEVKQEKHYWWLIFSSFADEVLLILAICFRGSLCQQNIFTS